MTDIQVRYMANEIQREAEAAKIAETQRANQAKEIQHDYEMLAKYGSAKYSPLTDSANQSLGFKGYDPGNLRDIQQLKLASEIIGKGVFGGGLGGILGTLIGGK